MEKADYEKLKDIAERLKKKQPTTFKERNILNIYNKRMLKKKKNGNNN
jgi:hypothetical protein